MPTTLKPDLVKQIADEMPHLTAKDVDVAVETMLRTMANGLEAGRRVEIRGFGCFAVRYRRARTGRNPKNGAQVDVAEKYVPVWKSGRGLIVRVNDSDSAQPGVSEPRRKSTPQRPVHQTTTQKFPNPR